MARLARVEVFAANEIAIVHVMNRTVRRCFLLGEDSASGKNYDHRKVWIDQQLAHQARYFGIDLLCWAIITQQDRSRVPVRATASSSTVSNAMKSSSFVKIGIRAFARFST
jgi:hypothetical protein